MTDINEGLPVQEEYNSTEDYERIADGLEAEQTAIKKQQEINQQADQQTSDEQLQREDPRNDGVGWNPGDIGAELSSAISGGLQDAGSSLATLPERAVDMFNGEMAEEGADYKPDWDPFVDDDNPIVTKTWWGGLFRGFVQFGALSAAAIGIAKVGALGAGAAGLKGLAGALGWAGSGINLGFKQNLLRGAALGAAGDVVSKDSQGDNLLGQINKHYPDFDNFLVTKDTDHPALKTFKNVVEGIGIGIVFDGVLEVAGMGVKQLRKGSPDAPTKNPAEPTTSPATAKVGKDEIDEVADAPNPNQDLIDKRNESTRTQEIERGKAQVERDEEYGAYKNGGDLPQGNAMSNGEPADVLRQANRIDSDWTAAKGSTDSLVTAKSLQRMMDKAEDLGDKELIEIGDSLVNQEDIAKVIKEAGVRGIPLAQVFPDSARRAKAMIEGRNTTDMSPEEYWEPFNLNQNYFAEEGTYSWTARNLVAADLVNVDLLGEIKALTTVANEVGQFYDINDVDGPVAAIKERLIYSFMNIKKMKSLTSNEFRQLQARDPKKAHIEYKKVMAEMKKTAQQDVENLLSFINANDPLDSRIHHVMNLFQNPKVETIEDFHKYARNLLVGGEDVNGRKKIGVIMKELGGLLVHSVLSGPKTIARALGGTGTMTFLRPLSAAIGAGMRGDTQTMRASLAATNALIQSIPDSWKFFTHRLEGHWSGDIVTNKTRMSNYTKGDDDWALIAASMEANPNATAADKTAFAIANVARTLNDNRWFTYSTRVMAAGDDGFRHIMLRAKVREKAVRESLDKFGKVDDAFMRDAEDRFMGAFTDGDGLIDIDKIREMDPELFEATKEVTLTTNLSGFSEQLGKLMESKPYLKPFFLFARTGINGLTMTAKHTPILGALMDKQRAIWTAARTGDLTDVAKYGITTKAALANENALSLGRQAIGTGVVLLGTTAFMNGRLRGNGPPDRQMRQTWKDAGWRANEVKIGDAWVNFEALEPFNTVLTFIADVGDNSQMMGETWATDQYKRLAAVLAETVTSKSYIAGLGQLVDVLQGDPNTSFERIIAGLMNNTVPLSSLRNEIGKLISPYMRELNTSLQESIRNRNKGTEIFAGGAVQELPVKYDILTGKPIKMHDFPTRMFNMFSPIQFNLDDSPGRQLLFNSKYDMRQSVMTINGISFADSPRLRSMYQKLLGDQNLELKLDLLAKDPKIQQSMRQMEADFNSGADFDPMKYQHNERIAKIFSDAQDKAWATLQRDAEVQELVQKERERNAAQAQRSTQINRSQLNELIEMPN